MKQNLITLKIKYLCNDSLLDVIRQYNSVLKFTYNRLLANPKLKTAEITQLQKSLNNCDLIGSHLKNSAIYDAKSLAERSTKPIIFGGKHLFKQRCQHIFNRRPCQRTVVYPKLDSVKNQLTLSLEELGIDVPEFNEWKNILQVVKESKKKYRFSTSEARNNHSEGLFSKFYKRKYLFIYTYL